MGEIKKGDLILNTNINAKSAMKFGIFLSYGKNAASQEEKRLSKVLIENQVVQIQTSFIKVIQKRKNDTKIQSSRNT